MSKIPKTSWYTVDDEMQAVCDSWPFQMMFLVIASPVLLLVFIMAVLVKIFR
jgi:hypothetical protein